MNLILLHNKKRNHVNRKKITVSNNNNTNKNSL